MKRKWTLFTYPTMDIKAAEAMLNCRAEQGWRLEKIWLGLLASFVPVEEPVCYCLDWYDPNREDELDYRTLLADAGWRRVGQLSYWNIYEAPAGTSPIQTDGELEYRRFRKKALRRMAIGWAIPLICLAVLVLLGVLVSMKPGVLGWSYFVTVFTDANTGAVVATALPLLLAGVALWSGRLLLRLGQWKRAIAREEPFPVPGRGSALTARIFSLVGYLFLIPLVLAFLLDAMAKELNLGWIIGMAAGCLIVLGKDPLPERTELEVVETHATLLSARTERREFGPLKEGDALNGVMDSEAWRLPWTWLADWVTEQYRKELGTANQEEVPGYENVWLERYGISGGNYPEEATGDVWLIRRGNIVLWVRTDMGPLDEDWLDGILARLEEDGA